MQLTVIENRRRRIANFAIAAAAAAAVVTGGLAAAPENSVPGATSSASAATVKAYRDGPVVFLNKSESRYVAAVGPEAAGSVAGAALGGPFGAGVGSVLGGTLAYTATNRVNGGECLMFKFRNWNPDLPEIGFYRWDGVCD